MGVVTVHGYKQAFKEARRRSGLTQREVSEATHIALGTLRRWEQGVNEPDVDSLVRISRLYGVTVGQLVGVDDGAAPSLPPDEQLLLDLYRSTDARGKAAIMRTAKGEAGVEGQAAGDLSA